MSKRSCFYGLALMMTLAGDALSQGTILFANNTDTRLIDYFTGEPMQPNVYKIGLYYGPLGSTGDRLALLATTGISPLGFLAGVFSGGTVTLPDVNTGDQVVVQVRSWDNAYASYEEAADGLDWTIACSELLIVTTGGGIMFPGDIVEAGFTGVTFKIPEPSTKALGLLGGLAVLVVLGKLPFWNRRREKA